MSYNAGRFQPVVYADIRGSYAAHLYHPLSTDTLVLRVLSAVKTDGLELFTVYGELLVMYRRHFT